MQEVNPKVLETLNKGNEQENLNVEKLIKFGILEEEVEPIAGWKVTMHPLSQEEQEKMELMVPANPEMSIIARSASVKRPTLIWAITKINNERFDSVEQKQSLHTKFGSTPGTLIDLLFLEYQKLYVKQFEMITLGIKKK